ncbi:MAG: cell envelope integrity protein TolA [Humidesulfovibrio sp.]|nr:cell envelope integrity protein TolA [Humidesulfovibrio sp.]
MQDSRRGTGFIFSLLLHALLVTVGMLNLGSSLKVNMDKPMYTVDLVSLNPSESPAAGDTGEPAPAPPPLAESQAQEQAAAAAIPPPPTPAKAEKPKPEPVVRDDAKLISEKKVEEKKKPEKKQEKTPPQPPKPEEKKLSREELLKQALQDVKKDVSEKSKNAKATAKSAEELKKEAVAGELNALRKSTGGNIFTAGGTGPGGAGGGKGTGAGGTGSGLMSVYGDIVKQIIKKNWRYPAFGTENNVAVTLEIRIDPQGKITSAKVATPSGKPDFDDSALRAVAETQVLPAPRVKSLDTLRITFNLQELRK